MPRPSKGARLWFDATRGQWIIRDGTLKRGTGFSYENLGGAEEALAEYLASKYTPPSTNDPARIFVSEVLGYYVKVVTPRHLTGAALTAIGMLSKWWEGKYLADVRGSACEAYIAWRMAQPNTRLKKPRLPSTMATPRLDLAFLRAAIKAYHREYTLAAVPEVSLPPPPPARTRFLTRPEAARLLWAARKLEKKGQAKALGRFIVLALYTATRTSAVLGLAWGPHGAGGWVDLQAGLIHRRADVMAETNKRRPPVRIPDHLMPFLRRWHREDHRDGGTARVVHLNGRPLPKLRLGYMWDEARTAAGLDRLVIRHTLRHTAVTWLLQAGVSIWDTASYAGMSPQIVESVYGHHHPDFQAEAAGKIGRKRKKSP